MKITINTDSKAFEDYGIDKQLEWIFRNIVRRVRNGETNFKIEDVYSNTCGEVMK